MQKINFNELMKKEIEEIESERNENCKSKGSSSKPSLLLHSCCGSCSTGCLDRLIPHFDVTLFFYNPNIDPIEEYELRIQAQKDVVEKIPQFKDVKLIIPQQNNLSDFYPRQDFIKAINLEEFPERRKEKECGSRCLECYEFRLKKTIRFAFTNKFDYWCTTLTLGPQKDALKINTIAEKVFNEFSRQNPGVILPKLLHADFKKGGGYLRSIQLGKEYGIYRQHYCGCVFGRESAEITKAGANNMSEC